jgi:hypothetical protein
LVNKTQSPAWKISKKLLLPLVLLPSTTLNALQPPVVSVHNMAYVVKYDDGGIAREATLKYKCYYEDVGWVSERGPEWHVRSEELLRVNGSLPGGPPYEIQPIDATYPNSNTWCPDRDLRNYSILFLRPSTSAALVEGFDQTHTLSSSHAIKILDSHFILESSGIGAFQPRDTSPNHVSPPQGLMYYTVSAEVLPGTEIDRRQVRAYLTQRQDLRLLPGHSYEFRNWSPEDAAAARKYYGKLNPTGVGDFANIGQKAANGDWVIELASRKAIQWYLEGKVDPDPIKLLVHPELIPRQWVTYKQSKIQLPIAVYRSRYFYDPSSDELVIFQVHHVELAP